MGVPIAKTFSQIKSVHPGKSVFDLSYEKKLTCDMGQLIPVMCDEMVPGDVFIMSNEIVARLQPLVAPILHEINIFVHYFFVPYRILWPEPSGWETFITGGVQGTDVSAVLPRWSPTVNTLYSLWDYLGFPLGIVPLGATPLDFVRRAYNRIYNEYYRDETLIPAVAETNEAILKRAWEKDYFTSCLPWQQRGTAPALPITGTTHAIFPLSAFAQFDGGSTGYAWGPNATTGHMNAGANSNSPGYSKAFFDNNSVDLSSASTFDVADLRLAFQIQKWMERNARAGVRYTEFLQSHFGVSPRDERLQRPEYIGGSKSPVIVSEVLQQSETATTPQGHMAGHGISVSQRFVGKYHACEFGVMMGIMSIMPRTVYQNGINRQWLRRTKYDFYFPEFANLSEQAIEQCEIYADGVSADNLTIFGYQGRFDEMRYKPSMVVSQFRHSASPSFEYWMLARNFTAAPLLNQTFIECVPGKLPFAVTDTPEFLINCANIIKAIRPLPVQANPGLIDHH
nr:MAG: major capsid protein [Microviridae sp.]